MEFQDGLMVADMDKNGWTVVRKIDIKLKNLFAFPFQICWEVSWLG